MVAFLKKIPLSTWVILGVLAFQLGVINNGRLLSRGNVEKPWPMISDAQGYYGYLPAFLIHDGNWEWRKDKDLPQRLIGLKFSLRPSSVPGKEINKYPIGFSVLSLPFFGVAHSYTLLSGKEATGFEGRYRLMIVVSAVFYLFLGLFFLGKTLRLFYSEQITWITLASVALGTNFFYYYTFEPGMTHLYSFACFAGLLYFTFKWKAEGKLIQLLVMAFLGGIIFLLRPPNVIIMLIPLIYCFSRIRENWKQVGWAFLVGLIVVSPQFLYWKIEGGSWLMNSYGDEGFLFFEPEVFNVLFSYRKGWLLYTPLMGLAIAGLFFVNRYISGIAIPITVYVVINLYLVSTWWSWWYGGGFGMRPLIEMSVPLSLALAALIQWALYGKNAKAMLIYVVLFGFISLNLFQTYQYRKTIIHWDSMTQKAYWYVFGRLEFSRRNQKTGVIFGHTRF